MNVADTRRGDLAAWLAVVSLPSRKANHGRRATRRRRYLPENRAAKKRQRQARKQS